MKSILAILIFVERSIPHVQSLILVCIVSLQFSQLDFPIEVSTLGLSAGALYGTLLDVALALIADDGAELGIEGGLVLGEVVQIDDSTMEIAEFDIADAVDEATKHRMENFGCLGDWIAIVEREVKSNLVRVEHNIVLGGVDVHSLGESSGRFCHGQLFHLDFVLLLV
jgi:hypothetical protein